MEFKTARFGSRAFPTYPCVFVHMRHAGGRGRVSTLLKSAIKCRDRVHRRDKREARESCCGGGRLYFLLLLFLVSYFSDVGQNAAKRQEHGPPFARFELPCSRPNLNRSSEASDLCPFFISFSRARRACLLMIYLCYLGCLCTVFENATPSFLGQSRWI